MEDDREIYPPGLLYHQGLGTKLTAAVADYLLMNQDLLANQNP